MLIDTSKTYRIQSFRDKNVALRLLSMGILPGDEIRIVTKSPFGKCYFLAVGNRWLAAREEELLCIDCVELSEAS